jgi:hypothetical protein
MQVNKTPNSSIFIYRHLKYLISYPSQFIFQSNPLYFNPLLSTMLYSIPAILSSFIILSLANFYRKWTAYSAFRAASIHHGCQRPTKYPHTDPFLGYDLVKARVKAIKDGNLTKLYLSHFDLLGKTWEENTFNQRTINTMDMRNIQHIAALNYEDFGKGGNMQRSPLIGPGILSLDGPAWKHAREMVKPIFSRAQLSDIESFEPHVDRFIELIPKDGGIIEIQAPLHKLVLLSLVWQGWMITVRH